MSQPLAEPYVSYAEYLASEEVSETKHEWLNGVVYAMSGGTIAHAALVTNAVVALSALLGGRPCRVYASDLRVRIPGTGLTTYPDASVVCGQAEVSVEDPHAITNPLVIVEVLSDSTERYDRGAKFAHYRSIVSLQEFVLISQNERRIEVYRRGADAWELREARAGGAIELSSIGGRLAVDEIYHDPLAPAAG